MLPLVVTALVVTALVALLAGTMAMGWAGRRSGPPAPGYGPQVFIHHASRGRALASTFILRNQIDPAMIPESAVRAAAASWGVAYEFGGPPGCGEGASPAGVQVVCVAPIRADNCPKAGCWSYYYFAGGIVLAPILVGRPDAMVQEAVCHELGNALNVAEQPPSAENCMAMSMNGHTNPPGSG